MTYSRRERLHFWLFKRWPDAVAARRLAEHATAPDPFADTPQEMWAFDQEAWRRGEVKLWEPER